MITDSAGGESTGTGNSSSSGVVKFEHEYVPKCLMMKTTLDKNIKTGQELLKAYKQFKAQLADKLVPNLDRNMFDCVAHCW